VLFSGFGAARPLTCPLTCARKTSASCPKPAYLLVSGIALIPQEAGQTSAAPRQPLFPLERRTFKRENQLGSALNATVQKPKYENHSGLRTLIITIQTRSCLPAAPHAVVPHRMNAALGHAVISTNNEVNCG
jgi:hypothetical protein